MDMIAWILFAIATIAVVILFVQFSDAKKQLADAQARLSADKAVNEVPKKQPVAVASGVGHVAAPKTDALADAEKRLHSSLAEVKRLEGAVAEAEKRISAEREKSESALAKASVAEAMVSQTRSRATEAGHVALQEAKSETEAVRAQLADAEKRLLAVADHEKRMSELVGAAKRAEAEAANGAERAKVLQTEVESLRTKLVQAEASSNAATFAVTAAKAEAEKTLRNQFEAQLRDAKIEFERDLQSRLSAERERFEAEQRRLSLELEKARLLAERHEAPAAPSEEPDMPVRPRTRPVATKNTEIGSQNDDKPLVVIADSDANTVKTIAQHLEAAGYAVRSANSVADAIQAARSSSPAAFAIDSANLPDGDCWSVLATMKEDPDLKEIPVMVFAPSKDKERAMEMGAAGCFSKPVDRAVLVATIKAATVKRKQRARLAAVTGGTSATRRSSLLTTPTQ
jgi:CheY-like chemotaxis protein